MSNAEKRAAANCAVSDSRIGEFTDKKIARMIGVSESLVNQVRRGITPEAATERVKARNGNGASAGKAAPRQSAEPVPSKSAPAPVPQQSTPDAITRPTKKKMLDQVRSWLATDCIDEDDLLKLIGSAAGDYVFMPKVDVGISLKVVGVSGRVQIDVPVSIKQLGFEEIVLRYTAGKLKDEGN